MVGGRNTDRSRKMKRTKASPRAVALLRKKKMAKMLRRKAAERCDIFTRKLLMYATWVLSN